MNSNIKSLCIPRIESSISKDYILSILNKLNVGYINKIYENPLRNDTTKKRIIIQIKWYNNMRSIMIQEELKKNKNIKLVYNMPWYWKIFITEYQSK